MFGILIFSLVLILIMAFFRWFGLVYYKKNIDTISPQTKKKTPPTPIAQTSNNSEDTNVTAVIFAAVSVILNQKVKVKKIQFVKPNSTGEGWGQTGRIQNMSNHWMSTPKTFKY